MRFSLPTMLKPRYTPEGSTDPLAPVEGESEQVEQGKIKGVHQFELTVFDAEESPLWSLPPTLLQYLVIARHTNQSDSLGKYCIAQRSCGPDSSQGATQAKSTRRARAPSQREQDSWVP